MPEYTPPSPMTPEMAGAVREFAARARNFCRTDTLAALLTREVQFLIEEGPETYLRYIRRVHADEVLGGLEQYLRDIADSMGDPDA